jgi:hypothetical protein
MTMRDREQLENAFDRAEGAQEIAFRNYRRAKAKNIGALIETALRQGKLAGAELRAAWPPN